MEIRLKAGEGDGQEPEHRAGAAHHHAVHFYVEDERLCEVVATHVGEGLRAGAPSLVIGTAAHRLDIRRRLRAAEVDVDAAVGSGQLEEHDAEEMLARILVAGQPHADRFDEAIGEPLRRLATWGQPVVAYGELVDLLWGLDRGDAAIALEELWQATARRVPLRLLCGYAMSAFAGGRHADGFDRVCALHDQVLPLPLPDPRRPQREIARLQQRAVALEAEIGRRVEAEAELGRQLEARTAAERELAEFLDHAVEGLRREDSRGIIQWANQAEIDLMGYPREQYVGHPTAEFHVDRSVAEGLLAATARGETVRDREVLLRHREGRILHVLVHSNGVFRDGGLHHTRWFSRDRTDQVVAEQASRRSELELRALTDALPMLVASCEPSGLYRYANAAHERWFGVDPASLVGLDPADLLGDRALVSGALASPGGAVEGRIRVAGEARNVEVRTVPLAAGGFLLLVTDTTEQIASLDRERAANRAKDEFLAMLGHELRNPLSPILTALPMLRSSVDESGRRELAVVERQARHLRLLVEDLLDVARITSGRLALERHPVELGPIVATALEMAMPLLEQRGQRIELDVAPGVWVDADAARIAQVAANLLTNAAKYSPPGTTVRVRVADERPATLEVSDSGEGIAPEILPLVFDPFVQGPEAQQLARGGLGLGLAVVRAIVVLHGGVVEAHSEGRGRGSTFVVRLPRAEAPVPSDRLTPPAVDGRTRGPVPNAGALPARRRRILVVDDNQDAAEMVGRALDLLGHVASVAFDGTQALQVAADFRPDVVLLDIGLPGMDGYELAERLRRLQPQVRLVALTGYGGAADEERSRRAGLDGHLVKPVQLEEIERLIDEL